ncbi:Non-ribosomal peptide synthetase component F [Hyunsoonleella jejuensis]|uniref:Non-ribosomal peptide synthetase component F n=1 Tax=Hyunsoonleella jejuensis TaxID=419940 RepID=A0A1H9KJN5_9FLAO|nr:condensation domain-containing protein [Hyunsoonleella jejuensis]SEQ99312.1 Non-ribosomal peptide synthetase component F [Hyunsoonleella jejuensis]
MNDNIAEKNKIQAIYPLTTMQQGILFHHLTVKDDQGFLNVQSMIDGDLNIDLLKASWDLAIKRHEVLRTSVHWEKIKSPVQIVKPKSTANWNLIDWSALHEDSQLEKLSELKIDKKKKGVNFQKQPLSELTLIKTKKDRYILVWSCHHLLLDGWSSSIILKDVFSFYKAALNNENATLESVPKYKSYLNYLKQIDLNEARQFWVDTFVDFKAEPLFNPTQFKTENLIASEILLSDDVVRKTQDLAKSYQVSPNTLFQGIWAVILAKCFNSNDVCFGNTVSGRSGNFPNIELMAGMFANVLPLRAALQEHIQIKNWLKDIQKQQLNARKFEHCSISEISEWIGNSKNNLFNSLFIFENFPWKDINAGNIKVHSSESGITTTYPLTLIVRALETIEIHLLSDSSLFPKNINSWILNRFEEIINLLYELQDVAVVSLLKSIKSINNNLQNDVAHISERGLDLKAPKNKIELELLKIWEMILDNNNISVQDNFFEIGGKSLMVVKMFTLIEKRLKIKVSPISLLEHPTIEKLSKFLANEDPKASWQYVVPIKAKGDKTPLFCIHGGGAYVFFFNPVANALEKDRPVYAIQPSGINGGTKMHMSIQEMAMDYAREIKDVQPIGPYNLLVYCFSPAVGIEIAHIFKSKGEETNLIVVDSIIKQEDFTDPTRIKMRISGFLNRLKKNPVNALKFMILNNYEKFLEPIVIKLFASKTKKDLENTKQNLVRIYKKYQWDKKHPGPITLILTDKPDPKLNPAYISAWEGITLQKINTRKTKGHHHQLFSSPYAEIMADKIEKAIIEST